MLFLHGVQFHKVLALSSLPMLWANCFQINYSLEFNMVDYSQKIYPLIIKNIFSEVGRYKYIVHATY